MSVNRGKQITAGLMLVLGVMLGFVAGQIERSHAQAPAAADAATDLQLVTYASGLTGVFDPEARRVYLYDSNLENCVAVRELGKLGEPMSVLEN